jgi:putative aldouronate transport system permease protein
MQLKRKTATASSVIADVKTMSTRAQGKWKRILVNYELYLFLVPALVFIVLFKYWPLYGLQLAFKDFVAAAGIWGSPWVGFENFERFFNSYNFRTILTNTLTINIATLVIGFPAPIILALMLNEVIHSRFRRVVQTATYAPHFISTVAVVGMIFIFFSPRNGLANMAIKALGGDPVFFMGQPAWFVPLYVLSELWQHVGWGAIIYLAALTAINPEVREAATVDGASKLQRILNVDLPGIMPVIVIMLILRIGNLMDVGFEKVFLMQNPMNISASEVINTYVYKVGLLQAQFGFATAVGLFNSVINFALLIFANFLSRRFGDSSLW